MSRRTFVVALTLIVLAGAAMRVAWLRADPPSTVPVGTVWHDEGPWTHNARNRVLFGEWRTDNWNPMYLAPVFTALEYAAFEAFGVGTWQARTVPVASGLAAIVCLAAGVAVLAGRRAALLAALLLSLNYGWVMWNRAALMESTMTAFIVAGWAAYAWSDRRPAWGAAAGAAAILAFFTKAAAAFFVAALALDAVTTLAMGVAIGHAGTGRRGAGRWGAGRWGAALARRDPAAVARGDRPDAVEHERRQRAAWWTLGGLAATGLLAIVVFVWPHWSEYHSYNWQMSVTRKPSYALMDLKDRATWLPVVQDFFMWMWPMLAAAGLGVLGVLTRWRSAAPAERLLVLWLVVGLVELVVHDAGNARRYVMFLPAILALGAMVCVRGRTTVALEATAWPVAARVVLLAAFLGLAYVVAGSLLRMAWLDEVRRGEFSGLVRGAALVALINTLALAWRWRPTIEALSAMRLRWPLVTVAVGLVLFIDLWHYALWAGGRTDVNYRASVAVGELLPEGTLVQGKLANGLALENRIRPIFIGNGFGNFEDRLRREDVRYILTYELPRRGMESQDGSGLIQGILDQYPGWRVLAEFDVDETAERERAVLIDKFGGR